MRRAHLLPLALLVLTMSCTDRAAQPRPSDAEGLIGAPPSRDADPFASQSRPPDSARAPSSGTIDIEREADAPPALTPSGLPADRAKTPRPVTVSPSAPAAEELAAVTSESRTSEQQSPPAPEVHKCFSCVKICPVTDRSGDCSQSSEDLICGWGTSQKESDAQWLARQECDNTLDMARQMPRFSRIDGACPAATCL